MLMAEPMPEYLTTREVADLIRLKERKVYDLVATGAIPCVRVTGKLLFPRSLIEAWLARHAEYGGGAETLQRRPNICAGSHDPLLDWALREAGTDLAVSFGGSLSGLERLAAVRRRWPACICRRSAAAAGTSSTSSAPCPASRWC